MQIHKELRHRILTWKTQMWEKTTATHRLQKITLYKRNTMSRKHRGNNLLSSSLATRGGYNEEATTSLSLSFSLSLCVSLAHSVQLTLQPRIFQSMCPKSYLYTYDFRAIYINIHSDWSDRSGPVLGWDSSLFLPSGGICFATQTSVEDDDVEDKTMKTIMLRRHFWKQW